MKVLRHWFALTETGVKSTLKAAVMSFFSNLGRMAMVMVFMFFAADILGEVKGRPLTYLLAILGTVIFTLIFLTLEYNNTYNATYREAKNLRVEIAEALKKLPLSYYSKHDLADLSQTVMQDVLDLEHAWSHALPQLLGLSAFLLLVIVLMMVSDWRLGLAVLLPILLGVVLTILSRNMQRRTTTEYYRELRQNSDYIQESIERQQEIKSYGLGTVRAAGIADRLDESERIRFRGEFKQAAVVSLAGTLSRLTMATVLVTGVSLYAAGQISILYIIGFLLAAASLSDAVVGIFMNIAEILTFESRSKRINEIRDHENQTGTEKKLSHFDVEVKDVSFSYQADTPVIQDCSFTARQGEVTALVGPSGCGKTTLLRLISRLFDYDQGEILIGGEDIQKISTDSLFDAVSMVFQEVLLFDDSVLENIRIGRREATDEEVLAAARLANCDDFVNLLPEGYQTAIGENGSKLSGGERQRISIARAFLKDAPILLLDEISSALDVENEMKVQGSLNRLIEGRTVIIVSHRLKSIEGADQIVVLKDGAVEAAGSHVDLLERSPLYRRLLERSRLTETHQYFQPAADAATKG